MFNELYKYVELYHNTILETKDRLSLEFKYFPTGCCGITCVLLGTFLQECGFGKFKLVIGERYYWNGCFYQEYSHSWLESETSIIIDITAYQFKEIKKKIIVQKNNSWYKSWTRIEELENVNIYNGSYINSSDLLNYETILKTIKLKNSQILS